MVLTVLTKTWFLSVVLQEKAPLSSLRWLHKLVFHVIYQTGETVSSGYPNSEKRVETTTRSGVFLTKFEVFG